MEINLSGINEVEGMRHLKPEVPRTQFIMLTAFQNTEYFINAPAVGATSYLLEQTPPGELLDAIKLVHAGGSPTSGRIVRTIVQLFQQLLTKSADGLKHLSPGKAQILDLLSKGLLYKKIAEHKKLAYAHIRNIYKVFHVRSRNVAISKYLRFSHSYGEFLGILLQQPSHHICLWSIIKLKRLVYLNMSSAIKTQITVCQF